jgi:hypothetical protein
VHVLQTRARAPATAEWAWRNPPTSGARPPGRTCAGLAVVGRRAVVVGGNGDPGAGAAAAAAAAGGAGVERSSLRPLADAFVLDLDTWVRPPGPPPDSLNDL